MKIPFSHLRLWTALSSGVRAASIKAGVASIEVTGIVNYRLVLGARSIRMGGKPTMS
jgi:hypothetical protein